MTEIVDNAAHIEAAGLQALIEKQVATARESGELHKLKGDSRDELLAASTKLFELGLHTTESVAQVKLAAETIDGLFRDEAGNFGSGLKGRIRRRRYFNLFDDMSQAVARTAHAKIANNPTASLELWGKYVNYIHVIEEASRVDPHDNGGVADYNTRLAISLLDSPHDPTTDSFVQFAQEHPKDPFVSHLQQRLDDLDN